MALPLLIVGIIFLFTHWFSGEHTVGVILTIVGAFLLALQLVVVGGIAALVSKR